MCVKRSMRAQTTASDENPVRWLAVSIASWSWEIVRNGLLRFRFREDVRRRDVLFCPVICSSCSILHEIAAFKINQHQCNGGRTCAQPTWSLSWVQTFRCVHKHDQVVHTPAQHEAQIVVVGLDGRKIFVQLWADSKHR